ncbi:ATP-binding protein [Actinacidiphila bryophytorum]|uniref:ATP-binding protein n=1 Tax=Actinacidiphila bryophytorum TaxID=1436133 RepID=UPI002176AE01|nr:ATP-binding protein [Actinacidiphila bryophytorum]UWE12233.1 ATP-binding protein [Actinacidiphila bryophytorum]
MRTPTTRQLTVSEGEFIEQFSQQFSSTRRGARLARHLALHELNVWGIRYGTAVFEAAETIVAELAANAVTHGCVTGRDFELRIVLSRAMLRIEVSDTRTERRPPGPGELLPPRPLAESGRGLLMVEAVADRWAVIDRHPVGKTVRAELDLPVRPGDATTHGQWPVPHRSQGATPGSMGEHSP